MTVSLLDKWHMLGAIMADPKLPGSAKSAAYFLLFSLNTQTERCDPSLIGLAERMGMSRRSVITGIAALIAGGYFERVAGGGRGVRTTYRPCWETVKQASQYQDPETVKQNVVNGEAERTKTVKQTAHEYGNRNREETGNRESAPPGSDSAPPEPPSKPSPARKKYAFEGTVIRLTVKDFETWANAYHGIPDIKAELTALDAWCAKNWAEGSPQRKGWFHRISNLLNKKHQEMLATAGTDSDGYWAEVEKGVIH